MRAASALSGIRIIDASAVIAIPYATALMADMGAEVIKVEAPHRASARNGIFNLFNRGKTGLTLDLTKPEGVQLFKELVMVSDVIVENYTPRVMRNFGLDYDNLRDVKPDIIMLSNTGFGHSGPWHNYMAFGAILEPMSGISSFTGYPDGALQKVGEAHLDFTVCWTAIFAIMAALHFRRSTGRGQYIDLSMYEAAVSSIGQVIMGADVNQRIEKPMPQGNRHPFLAPHGCYPCKGGDHWVTIAVTDEVEWRALCDVMGCPDLADAARFGSALCRHQHQDELDSTIADWTRSQDHYEIMYRLQQAGVPAGAVLSNKELLLDPHLQARGFYELVPPCSPIAGVRMLPQISRAWKMPKTPAKSRVPAPGIGEHSAQLLHTLLDVSPERFSALEQRGVVSTGPTGEAAAYREQPLSPEDQLRLGLIQAHDANFLEILNKAYGGKVLDAVEHEPHGGGEG